MTEAYVMEKIPEDIIRSEGARLMALSRKDKSRPSEQMRKAANARWKKRRELLKMAKTLGIPNCEAMTNKELDAAIDKVFD
jgi:hypothetical protein